MEARVMIRVCAWLLGITLATAVHAGAALRLGLTLDTYSTDIASLVRPLQIRLNSHSLLAQGDLPQQRSNELSEQQIVVAAYDADGRELRRLAVLDPRLLIAETLDAQGHLVRAAERVQPHSRLDLLVPAETDRIALFKPQWNGRDFELLPLAQLRLGLLP